jgi:hypothetical protein
MVKEKRVIGEASREAGRAREGSFETKPQPAASASPQDERKGEMTPLSRNPFVLRRV